MPHSRTLYLLLAAVLAATGPAGAQTAPETPSAQAGLELTAEQRDLIYASVSSNTALSTAAPSTFLPRPGVVVPPSIATVPMPDPLVTTIPRLRGYRVAFVAGHALVIDPQTARAVEVIVRP